MPYISICYTLDSGHLHPNFKFLSISLRYAVRFGRYTTAAMYYLYIVLLRLRPGEPKTKPHYVRAAMLSIRAAIDARLHIVWFTLNQLHHSLCLSLRFQLKENFFCSSLYAVCTRARVCVCARRVFTKCTFVIVRSLWFRLGLSFILCECAYLYLRRFFYARASFSRRTYLVHLLDRIVCF